MDSDPRRRLDSFAAVLWDMNWDLIRGEIDRAGQTRRSGPTAEHVLKALRENAATREIPLVPVAR